MEIEKLDARNITFIFIDLQESLLSKISGSEKIVSRNTLLFECASALEIPFVVTTQYQKGLGALNKKFADRVACDPLDKTTFSCVADGKIREEVMRLENDWIALGGIETHICVLQTALDLLRDGYRVAVVADATSARKPLDHELGLKRMEDSGVLLVSTEMLIYELLGRSDRENFKKLLPFIKAAEEV